MATKSIFKDVRINDKSLARNLINALENAKKTRGKNVSIKKMVTNVEKSDIKKFFEGKSE